MSEPTPTNTPIGMVDTTVPEACWPFPLEGLVELPQSPSVLNARTVHLFNKDCSYGGITIVYSPVLHDAQGVPTGDFARVAVSICNPNDRYNRKLGEVLALTNLWNNQYLVLPIYRGGHPVRVLKQMFGVLPVLRTAPNTAG